MLLKIPYAFQMVLFTRFPHMFLGYVSSALSFFSYLTHTLSALVHQGFTALNKSAFRRVSSIGGVLSAKLFQQNLSFHFCFFCESPIYVFYDDH